jgi:hypothetical protein
VLRAASGHRASQFPGTRDKVFLGNERRVPRQRSFGCGIIEIPGNNMHMEVRDDIAKELIVDMTRLEHAFDGAPDVLNVQPVISEFLRCKLREGRDVSSPKHHCRVASRDGMPFKKSFADSTAVKRLAP